jgi:mannose-6-phosphate isomerase-like protein (cupin superfamily)
MSVFPRITDADRPPWASITSAGSFRIEPETDWPARDEGGRAYVMGRFDPHYHDGDEYWLISSGRGVIKIEDETFDFAPGDIICIERGKLHDVVGVYETVDGFWFQPLSPSGQPTGHMHRRPEDAEGHPVALLTGEAA